MKKRIIVFVSMFFALAVLSVFVGGYLFITDIIQSQPFNSENFLDFFRSLYGIAFLSVRVLPIMLFIFCLGFLIAYVKKRKRITKIFIIAICMCALIVIASAMFLILYFINVQSNIPEGTLAFRKYRIKTYFLRDYGKYYLIMIFAPLLQCLSFLLFKRKKLN